MNYQKLKEHFLNKAANSTHPILQDQAVSLQDQMMQMQEDTNVVDADVQKEQPAMGMGQAQLEIEDLLLQKAMPEMQQPDSDDSSFGKVSCFHLLKKKASAYVRDVPVKELPSDTVKDVSRFIGDKKERKVVQYGMVVSELLPKVDKPNFEQAVEHIKESIKGKNRKELLQEFYKKARDKYIIMLNDKIIDGHHFLAKAKELEVTNSLNVIDLTPVRFQEKTASVFSVLKSKYVTSNNRR